MKKLITLKKFIGICFLLFFGLSNQIQAQVIKAFSQRTSVYTPAKQIYSIQGDYAMIGNTNLTLQNYGNFTNNSLNVMEYVDVDTDPNTFNSSSATLEFSNENGAIPQCSNIIYAGLYWTGRASNTSSSPEEFPVTHNGITKNLNKRKVYVKGPGQTNYTEFTANPGNIYYPNGTQGNMYSGYVEVTDYVQNNGLGEYTVADIALIEGNGGSTGYYGGWGMIVIYENSVMNWRDITIFDGHAYVQGNATLNYELPISGFQTVQTGPVNMKVGLMAGEGDVGISGDYFRIRNWQDNQWITLSHSGNSNNNFFNSSVETGGNPRNPNLQNNTGLDISSFNVPNPANSVITNNQTSTRFQYGSTQDTYIIFCIAMAVDAYVPDVEALVSTEYINGQPVGSGPISATPGQVIDYKLEVRNKGTEPINNMQVTIPIPYNTSFVPSSIGTQINFSPIPTPNNAYFDPLLGPTGSIVWDFGDLPLPPGSNPDSVLAEITFQLEVTTDCFLLTNPDCPPTVVLSGGNTTGEGAISGADFDLPFVQGFEEAGLCIGEPITEPLIVDIDADTYVQNNCQSVSFNSDYVFCNYENATLPVDSISQYFPSGLSFYNENTITTSSIKYDEDNPFPATPGTSTYFAIPDGVSFCYYTFTITIQDSISTSAIQTSQVSCPGFNDGAIDLSVNGGTPPFSYSWVGPSSFVASTQDINNLEEGTYNVELTDSLGCQSFNSTLVTAIPDVTAPTILCVSNSNVNVDGGLCTYTHIGSSWDPQATDNCNVSSLTYTLSGATSGSGTTLAGVAFNQGVTNVVWTATDDASNTSSCSYNVTVVDNEDPSILSCGPGSNQTVNTDFGNCSYTHVGSSWDASASDNCSLSSISYSLNGATSGSGTTLNGVVFNVGITTVTWTATDVNGNSEVCVFQVTVNDSQAPVISSCGPTSNQVVNVTPGLCNYTHSGSTWDAIATDNCGVSTISYTLTGATSGTGTSLSGTSFNIGTTNVTWSVEDNNGNISTCNFNVNVIDNEDPVISSCGGSGTETVNVNASSCTYTHSGTAWNAIASDNCTVTSLVYTLTGATSGTGTTLSGVTFNVGTTTVVWTATDAVGNTTTCTFNVEVIDNINPSFTSCGAGGNQSVDSDPGTCSYTHSGSAWDATASDNCTVTNISYTLTGATSGTGTTLNGVTFGLGVTNVLWTATDVSGNISTCSFNVTVVDKENPVIVNCGAGGTQTVNADPGSCSYTHTGTAWNVTASDNCSSTTSSYVLTGATSATGTGSLANEVFNVGTTTVTWTVTDGSGNSVNCSFLVVVEDTQLPVISSCGAPGPQVVNTDPGVCTYSHTGSTWDAAATDNCTTVTMSYTLTGATSSSGTGSLNGATFNTGITNVIWKATDVSGNISNCSFTVEVIDNEPPVVNACVPDITANAAPGSCSAVVNWSAPDITDNCSLNIISSHASGDVFNTGTTVVTYTATDNAGNAVTCSFNVTVVDAEAPTISCNADIETCDSIVTYSAPIVGDNCGVQSVSMIAGLSSGSIFPVGNTTVTYEVIDVSGLTNTCSFTVERFELPEVQLSAQDALCFGQNDGSINAAVTSGTAPYSYNWSNGSSTQNIDQLQPGVYTLVVTDDNGCSASANETVSEPVQLTLGAASSDVSCFGGNDGGINITVNGGTSPYSYNWSNGTSNEDLVGVSIGNYNVVVTDNNGCQINYSATLSEPSEILISSQVFDASCSAPNGAVQVVVTGGVSPYQYNWSNGATTAGISNVTAGDYTLTVTDANGCNQVLEVTVGATDNLSIESRISDVKCFGESNGSASVIITSGSAPFTYEWSNGDTTSSISNVAAGNYTVTVTDAVGCTTTLDIEISEPDELNVLLTAEVYENGFNVTPFGNNNGSVLATVSGGTTPYNYIWSNGEVGQQITGLTAGQYAVTVRDFNNCTVYKTIVLTEVEELAMPTGYSPNNDGMNDYFVVKGLEAYADNKITVFNRWGNIVYQRNSYQNDWAGLNSNGNELPDATYFVVLEVETSGGSIVLKGYVDLRR